MKLMLCFVCADFRLGNNELSRRSVYNVIARYQSQGSSIEKMKASGSDDGRDVAKVEKKTGSEWNVELDWFSKTLEPALQMLKRALPAGLFMFIFYCTFRMVALMMKC